MHFTLKRSIYGVFLIFFLKKRLSNIKNMAKKLSKDYFLRKQYKRFEMWNKLNKSLKKSQLIYNIPTSSLLKKKKIYSKTPIRNYCFRTGRGRGIVPFFRVSRMLVRKNAGIGLFRGVHKNN